MERRASGSLFFFDEIPPIFRAHLNETRHIIWRTIGRRRFWLAFLYIGLLVASGTYRRSSPETPINEDRKEIVFLTGAEKKTRIAYKEKNPANVIDTTPIVMIHGSPGDSDAFDSLTEIINDRRIISIDLPGFGNSEKDIPDYSIEAHARYLRALMDELRIERAHFVGFSMGGGVVLELQARAPNRVGSIVMISAIGVQEYELFGDYYANHLVHAAQLGAIFAVQELTPHFGIFDGGLPYARNFYDSDQRPLRKILETIETPFLIIHGTNDPLVPVEAAREHARIVPQSELVELDDNHFFIFMRPAKIQPILKEFWRSAEVGSAKTRASADADRKKAAAMPFTGTVIAARGPTVFVFFFVIFLLALIRADAAFLISGIFAAQGWFGPGFAVLACLVSVVAAIFGGILAGRLFGTGSSRWRGETPGFSGSIPGFRVAPYLAAVRDVSWRRFFRYSAYAGCWSILLTGFGFGVSSGIIRAFGITSFWVLTLVVVVLFASIRAGIAYFLLKADEIPER